MAINTSTVLAGMMITSLFLSSLFISYFALEIHGIDLGYIDIEENLGDTTVFPKDDYRIESVGHSSIFTTVGTWTQSNIGLSLSSMPLIYPEYSAVFYNNLKPDKGGYVTNTYKINNSVKQPYGIILAFDPPNGKWINNRLIVDSTGFHVPNTLTSIWEIIGGGTNDVYFYPYPNAEKIEDVVITTTYNTKDTSFSFIFNGQQYTGGKINEELQDRIYEDTYGGVITNSEGFTLETFSSVNSMGDNAAKEGVLDGLTYGLALITTMIRALTFGLPLEIMPATIQLIFIRSQEFVLGLAIYGMLRSG